MRRLQLEAAEDHVQNLARQNDALGAVKELIWNALDADALKVQVDLELSPLGSVERVTVIDDGTGIAPEGVNSAFERIGGSWKKSTHRTLKLGRSLHGSRGQGRLRGHALGDNISWTTTADGIGGRFQTVITASASAKKDFEISDSRPTDAAAGTVFEAWGRQSVNLDKLLKSDTIRRLTSELALYLITYPEVEVLYRCERIEPQSSIQHDTEIELSFAAKAGSPSARLRVVEWTLGVPRELHLCDATGVPLGSTDVKTVKAPGFNFTAYVMWDSMSDHVNDILLGDLADSDLNVLLAAARDSLKEHFKQRINDRRQEVIDQWIADGIYPYRGKPANDSERVERETFDLVATTVHRHLPRKPGQQRTTLVLLREAVRTQPDSVHRILEEIFRLTEDDRAQLDHLLTRTSLPHIIKASKSVTDRLDFLAALSQMVFDKETRRITKERSQLHKLIENEAWIFGEHYALLVSDKSLNSVLDRHLAIIGRPKRSPGPVLRPDGTTGIVDLMLSRARKEHDRRQHLVVELKAPGVKVGQPELAQIRSYAHAVAQDPQFRNVRTDWDFWLVTTEMDPTVRMEARQQNRPAGCVTDFADGETKLRVWVRTWAEIIDECHDRLQFFKERFAHDPDLAHAIEYLNQTHTSGIIPELLRLPAQTKADPVAVA